MWALIITFLALTALAFHKKQISNYRVGTLHTQDVDAVQPICSSGALLLPRSDGQGLVAPPAVAPAPALPSSCRLPAFPPDLPLHAALPQASLWSLAAVTCALSCLICFMTYSPLDYIAVRDGQKALGPGGQKARPRTVWRGQMRCAGLQAACPPPRALPALLHSPPAHQPLHIPTHPSLLRTPPCVPGTAPRWRVLPSTPAPRCCSSCWATPSFG